MRWARRKSDEELRAYIARFPKLAGKLAAHLLKEGPSNGKLPKTDNLKADAAAHILKRRSAGLETISDFESALGFGLFDINWKDDIVPIGYDACGVTYLASGANRFR